MGVANPYQPSALEQQQFISSFLSEEFVHQRKYMENQQQLQEITNLFRNYVQTMGLDPQSESNSFVANFYNKYPRNASKAEIDFMKEHLPKYVRVNKK